MKNIKKSNELDVTVIGGGIGGLFAAWKLSQHGYKTTIIERAKFLGGLSASIKKNNCFIDIGPHYVTLDKTSTIFDDIHLLLNKDSIIELSSIKKSYKSFFQNQILDTPPRLSNILKNNKNSFVRSLIKDVFQKTKNSTEQNSSEEYLISLYGSDIYESYCKPILHQYYGEIPPVNIIKNSFEPITIKKTLNYLTKNQKVVETDGFEPVDNGFVCYFKNGMGTIIDSLQDEILNSGGKIILDANVESIDHGKPKLITYTKNNEIFQESSDIILYSVPLKNTIKWFKDTPDKLRQQSVPTKLRNGILVFLLVDISKLFDGWVLDIYDLSIPFFRITQQTFLSSGVAPKNKSLLCFEMRSNPNDDIWSFDDHYFFELAKNNLQKIFQLENIQIDELEVLKLKNLYRRKYDPIKSFDKEIVKYIHSFSNEFALGTTVFDTGDNPSRVSSLEVAETNKTKNYGGFYNSLTKSKEIIEKILLNNS
tara:strand:+ start:60 stop:1499 length:1440 start_codon:yes stop_codon:yes gene_type:complete